MSTGSRRVLVVEDNARNSKLACAVLEAAGIGSDAVESGAGAADYCATRTPDLILLDIQLPDRSGIDVLRDLRANPATAGIAVVALTAFAMDGDRERLLTAGFNGYISKPIDVASFADTVRSLMGDGS